MRYELRTRFTVDIDQLVLASVINSSDKLLRWLYEYLPRRRPSIRLARPRWLGGRYNERPVTFELVTSYRDVFQRLPTGCASPRPSQPSRLTSMRPWRR